MPIDETDKKILDGIKEEFIEEIREGVSGKDARKVVAVFFDLPSIGDDSLAETIAKRIKTTALAKNGMKTQSGVVRKALKANIHRILEKTPVARVKANEIRPLIQWMDAVELQIDAIIDGTDLD